MTRETGVHTKDSKMVLVTALLNTQHYKIYIKSKDACGVMDIVVGNGHDDTSSNPGPD